MTSEPPGMPNPENPYAAPSDDIPTGAIQYGFEGVVGFKDLGRMTGRWKKTFFFMGLTILMGLLQLDSGGGFFGGLSVLFLVWMAYLAWTGPLRIAKRDPGSIGWMRGSLGTDFIEFENEAAFTRSSTEVAIITEVKNTHITIASGNVRRIPRHLFADFTAATRLAQELRNNAPKPRGVGDPRAEEPVPDSMRPERTPGSVPFEGPIVYADMTGGNFAKHIRKARRQYWIWIVGIFLCVAIVFLFTDDPGVKLPIGIGGAVMLWAFYKAWRPYREIRRIENPEEAVLANYVGHVNEDGVTSANPIGVGRYAWKAFDNWCLQTESQTIMLEVRGAVKNYILINRRQVSSDSNWEKIQQLIGDNVASSETPELLPAGTT